MGQTHWVDDLRSVSREGTEHGRAKTLEESLRTLVLQENTEDISGALVGASRGGLEARLEDIWGNGNGPHSNTGHT